MPQAFFFGKAVVQAQNPSFLDILTITAQKGKLVWMA